MKTTITLEFPDMASAAVALLALRGPLPTYTVTPHVPTVVDPINAEAPAPAPQVTDSDREAVATPVAAAPIAQPKIRTRKTAPVAAVKAPVVEATEPAAVADEVKAPVPTPPPAPAAAPFVPPLGPTFTLDKPETVAPKTPGPTKVDAPTTPAPWDAAPALSKVQEAVEAVLNAKGTPYALAVLSRFGVKRTRELLDEQRADFITYCGKVISGAVDPIAGSKEVA